MSERINKGTLIALVSQQTGQDAEIVTTIIDAFLNEIYHTLQQGESITLKNFGNFYVRPEPESWVFKFNPSQKWRALFGWSSTHKE
jgi:DNA-binding protein HU-beta